MRFAWPAIRMMFLSISLVVGALLTEGAQMATSAVLEIALLEAEREPVSEPVEDESARLETSDVVLATPREPRSGRLPIVTSRQRSGTLADISVRPLGDTFDHLYGLNAPSGGAGAGGVVSGVQTRPDSGDPVMVPQYFLAKIFPGVGYVERFLVHAPIDRARPRPMLVVFHKYNVGYLDALANTQFIQECMRRDWYVVCPLSASGVNFSSIESQVNTEAVLDWMVSNQDLNVDTRRVYGVGFSMGGGSLTNYAARHVDPSGVMFAAIVNHTGGVALKDSYANAGGAEFVFDFWFGDGTPGSADPFKLARSSILNFDPVTLAVEDTEDLARNLLHVPMRIVRAQADPLAYLATQCDVLYNHMLDLGAVQGVSLQYDVLPGTEHEWDTLDEGDACDWLEQFSLEMPNAGRTLADEDETYFFFGIEQDAPNAFSPFEWSVDNFANSLTLSKTANLTRVTVATTEAGLDPFAALQVATSTDDGLADEIVLSDYAFEPFNVLRDGLATVQGVDWTYEVPTGRVHLHETDGTARHVWDVQP